MSNKVYKATLGHDGKFYPDGPGASFSFYSGTLFPAFRFAKQEQANIAADIANRAYVEGYAKAQENIRNALGVSK